MDYTKQDLDRYLSKTKHTQAERKAYTAYMKEKYESWSKTYHEVKIKYRSFTNKKLTFKQFKETFELEYMLSGSVEDSWSNMFNKTNLTNFDTPDIERYFEVKEKNFEGNLANIKKKLRDGVPLTELEKIMLDVDNRSKNLKSRDFMWKYFQIVALAGAAGIMYQAAFDSPEEN